MYNSSPTDSLSPLLDHADSQQARIRGDGKSQQLSLSGEEDLTTRSGIRPKDAGALNSPPQQTEWAFPAPPRKHEPASFRTVASTTACSPRGSAPPTHSRRPRRPAPLKLHQSNGSTTLERGKLVRRIDESRATSNTAKAQVPRHIKVARRIRSHPALMGNRPSSLHGSPEPPRDNASLTSVRRRPMQVLRKSSTNLFKRIESKSPLPRPMTAASIIVTAGGQSEDSAIDVFTDPPHSAKDSIIMLPSASTLMPPEEVSTQTLSVGSTIRSPVRDQNRSPYQSAVEDVSEDEQAVPLVHRGLTLSPTIPAPSPLPEDSPHKYGLMDHMDTPRRPQEVSVHEEAAEPKAAGRISSGAELFNVSWVTDTCSGPKHH